MTTVSGHQNARNPGNNRRIRARRSDYTEELRARNLVIRSSGDAVARRRTALWHPSPVVVHDRTSDSCGCWQRRTGSDRLLEARGVQAKWRTQSREDRYVDLDGSPTIIGRAREADVLLTDPIASRLQAEIRAVKGIWILTHLSKNCDTVLTRNGSTTVVQASAELRHGDLIRAGRERVRFVSPPAADSKLADEVPETVREFQGLEPSMWVGGRAVSCLSREFGR